ncbi:hypothetical protein CY35_04G081800 [Sphagnum magellanicum]|nr:hypothetical protein CY35_04G081800 [Sphagnum magellanicum]
MGVFRMKVLFALSVVIGAWMVVASFLTVVDAVKSVPAYFVFGDSVLDVGENNYVPNAEYHANFPPYGETFFHRPTGRFSNGRNLGDFFAQALALPFAPPYLQPNATFNKGINFASGGSGVLNTTNAGLAIPLGVQLKQYQNATAVLVKELGVVGAKNLISKALFLIASGSNDLTAFLILLATASPAEQKQYNATQYISSIIDGYTTALETLYASGARKVVLFGVGLTGCSPSVRSANNGSCVIPGNELALGYNEGLKLVVDGFHTAVPDFHLVLTHSYDLISDLVKNPTSFGLKNVTGGCCGAGFLHAQFQCGTKVPANFPGIKQALCKHPSTYLYWDFVHVTEHVDKILFGAFWDGNSSYTYPINVRSLALLETKS